MRRFKLAGASGKNPFPLHHWTPSSLVEKGQSEVGVDRVTPFKVSGGLSV